MPGVPSAKLGDSTGDSVLGDNTPAAEVLLWPVLDEDLVALIASDGHRAGVDFAILEARPRNVSRADAGMRSSVLLAARTSSLRDRWGGPWPSPRSEPSRLFVRECS